jgi:hypothetical protein
MMPTIRFFPNFSAIAARNGHFHATSVVRKDNSESIHAMRAWIYLTLFAAISQAAEIRSWTDLQDRKIEARMLGLEGETVMLELVDGRKIPYPLAKLSAADAEYAKNQSSETVEKTTTQADAALNFDAPWPDRIKFSEDPEIVVVEEDVKKKSYIYQSANYSYTCDVRLAKSVVKSFAVMFEATHLFCRSLPLAIDGGDKTEGKHQIVLFEKTEDYVKAGGLPQSAGVFISGKGLVMVPLESLGVRSVGNRYVLDRDKSSKTLPHELTHQLTPVAYFRTAALGWFSEGLAEYVAVTPYRSGAFAVKNNHRDIIDYVTAHGDKNKGGRALGTEIGLPSLKTFMLQSYSTFLEQAQLNYGGSLLITYYFLQMDGEGDGKRIKEFLKGLRKGKSREEALNVLLAGQTFEELQAKIVKAWSRKGIDLTFAAEK